MSGNQKFPKLMEAGFIGSIKTRNRILRMGASPGKPPYENGRLQEYYFDFYGAIARGGVGLVTVSGHPIDAPLTRTRGYSFDDDKYIPRFRKLTDLIHQGGCPTFMQLMAIGPWVAPPGTTAASSIPRAEMPILVQNFPDAHELTDAEIKDIVSKFTERAERAQKAGFDGIELNAACNHLLNTFLSRAWNRRTDRYGCGTIENRARIVMEIISSIKKRNGNDFGVAVVFNAAEPGLKDGITSTESQELAKYFEAAGADAIQARAEFYVTHLSDNVRDSTHFPDVALYPAAPLYAAASGMNTKRYGVAGWAPFAAAIKKAIKIPVIAVGRMDPETAEKMLERGEIDFVNLNRRLIADHGLPHKIREGRPEDIAPCTACMNCFDGNEKGQVIKCRINPAMGKESEYEIRPAARSKKVVVIGSGPAGLEASRIAALRGHQVTLLEKEPMLGGAMNIAAIVKGAEREDLVSIIEYYKRQLTEAGVDVRIGKTVTSDNIAGYNPDVIIVATGGSHFVPDIPGIDRDNVLTGQVLHYRLKNYLKITGTRLMTKLTRKYIPVGIRVIVLGGGIQGCQTAEFLVKRGRKVTIVEAGPEIGTGLLTYLIKPQLLDWLNRNGVEMIAGVHYDKVISEGLVITDKNGNTRTIKADTLITAMPLLPDHQLFNDLSSLAPEVYEIGDGKQQGLIVDAVADGASVGRLI